MSFYIGNKKVAGLIRGEDISHATETHAGIIEIATQDEVNAGTNDSKAITPYKAKSVYGGKVQIDYLGNKVFKVGDTEINYKTIHDLLLVSKDFTFIVYGNRAYLCSFVNDESTTKELRFESVINSDGKTKTSSIYVTSNDGVNITNVSVSDINSENQSNKVTTLTGYETNNNTYPTTKAVADSTSKLIPRGGVVVVLGDSLFEINGMYSFADFLNGKGIYREVINYAVAGCRFKSDEASKSLSDILQRPDVQYDIARADEIWMHVGGNDAFWRMLHGGSVDDLALDAYACFAPILTLNPNVLIRYVRFFQTPPELANKASKTKIINPDTQQALSNSEIVNLCESVFTIDYVLSTCPFKVLQCNIDCENIAFEMLDEFHPTPDAVTAWFEALLSAEFYGVQTMPYILVHSDNVSGMDELISNGKISGNCTVCIVDSESSAITTIPMHSVDSEFVGTVVNPSSGNATVAKIKDGHLSVTLEEIADKVSDVQVAGTSIVQDGVAKLPNASSNVAGVCKPGTGMTIANGDLMCFITPADSTLNWRSPERVVTNTTMDLAVKHVLCDPIGTRPNNTSPKNIAWTDEEKQYAQTRIGFIPITREEYALLDNPEEDGNIYFFKD